ncbi:H2A protein, partial [Turnix velox]|nr:H2A protein [Turnix velox]
RGGAESRARRKAAWRSFRPGLQFPVGRIHRLLRLGGFSEPVASVLEYLTTENLELMPITPQYFQLAIRNDEELDKLLGGVTMAQGGILPMSCPRCCPRRHQETLLGSP